MKSVFRCVTLCVILAIAMCYDSEESNESFEDLFMNRNTANRLIKPSRPNPYGIVRRPKSPYEVRSEICESSYPCKVLARTYGKPLAYQRYFGGRQGNTNNYHYRY